MNGVGRRSQALVRALTAGWWCLAAALAHAQSFEFEPGATSPFSCLSPAVADMPKPVYPPRELEMRADGFVRLRLEFTHPDRPPKVTSIFRTSEHFEDAVLDRVRTYRLPCLDAAAAPVVAFQEFSFDPRDGRPVLWSPPAPVGATKRRCEAHGLDTSNVRYPSLLPRGAKDTNVLARATYGAPNEPPKIEILNKVRHRAFEFELISYLEKTSVDCAGQDVKWPISALQVFKFHMEGNEQVALQDMGLKAFVAAISGVDKHQVRFDLSSMSCPFDVQFRLYQPFAPNSVGEVGASDPNRTAFLAWLRTVSLRIPDETLNQVVGDTMRISVPCGVLDLTS